MTMDRKDSYIYRISDPVARQLEAFQLNHCLFFLPCNMLKFASKLRDSARKPGIICFNSFDVKKLTLCFSKKLSNSSDIETNIGT